MLGLLSTSAVLVVTSTVAAFAAGPEPMTVAPAVAAPPPAPSREGGYAGAQIGYAYGDFDAGSVFDGFDVSDTNWVSGFGYDYRLRENWTIGGEFMYHGFDDINVNTLHVKAAYRF